MDAVTPPSASSTDVECPGCAATAQACLSIIGLLPTPQLRAAALLATLRTEVARRSGKDNSIGSNSSD